MDKSSFLKSTGASRSVAESAWARAEGDEEKARELLEPVKYHGKGRFSDPDEGFYGLFCFTWHVESSSASGLQQAVLSNEDIAEVSLSTSKGALTEKIERFHQDGSTMGGYSSELKETLESALAERESELHQALSSRTFEAVDDLLADLIGEELELGNMSVTTEVDSVRKIQTMETESKGTEDESDEEETVTIQVSAEINPVKGLPVTKIKPGHKIFVRPGEEDGADRSPVRDARKYANEDGLVPAKVVSKESSPAGNLRMMVELPNGVSGTLKSGKDVSILVPEATRDRINSSSSEMPEILKDEIVLGASLAIIILLILGLWLFL